MVAFLLSNRKSTFDKVQQLQLPVDRSKWPIFEKYMKDSEYSRKELDKAQRYHKRFLYEASNPNPSTRTMMRVRDKVLHRLFNVIQDLPNDMKREVILTNKARAIGKDMQNIMYELFGRPFDRLGYTAFNDTFHPTNELRNSMDFTSVNLS